MKYLRSLIENLTCSCLQGSLDTEVRSIAYDSRKVEEGALFVCIRGAAEPLWMDIHLQRKWLRKAPGYW